MIQEAEDPEWGGRGKSIITELYLQFLLQLIYTFIICD